MNCVNDLTKFRKRNPSTFIAIRDFVPTLPAEYSQATATTAITWQAVGGFMNRSSTSAPSPNTLAKTVNKYATRKADEKSYDSSSALSFSKATTGYAGG